MWFLRRWVVVFSGDAPLLVPAKTDVLCPKKEEVFRDAVVGLGLTLES